MLHCKSHHHVDIVNQHVDIVNRRVDIVNRRMDVVAWQSAHGATNRATVVSSVDWVCVLCRSGIFHCVTKLSSACILYKIIFKSTHFQTCLLLPFWWTYKIEPKHMGISVKDLSEPANVCT